GEDAELQKQERQGVERRGEMGRHLSDMGEWYRRKLRELAESSGGGAVRSWGGENDGTIVPLPSRETPAPSDASPTTHHSPLTTTAEPSVLSLTDDLDPGDRQLGDLLRALELVDADTLTALLLEARR